MAIAHIATEYVFSDFLLKEPPETRYKGLRLELALDKIVTCIAVGLPLLLISLAFAQEVSIGNRPPRQPSLPALPAPPAADKGLGGAARSSAVDTVGLAGGELRGEPAASCREGFPFGGGGKRRLWAVGSAEEGEQLAGRASLAAGGASVRPSPGVLGIPAGLSRSSPCPPPPWGIPYPLSFANTS